MVSTFIPTWWAAMAGGAQVGGDDGGSHEADAHQQVFQQDIAGQVEDAAQGGQLRPDAASDQVGQADKGVRVAQGEQAHGASHYGAEHRGDGGAGDAQGRKAEVPFDEQVVAADVQNAGGHIGGHGDPGVAAAPEGGVDDQRDHAEEQAAHDDAEVGDCGGVGVRGGAAQVNDRICKQDAEEADDHAGRPRSTSGR